MYSKISNSVRADEHRFVRMYFHRLKGFWNCIKKMEQGMFQLNSQFKYLCFDKFPSNKELMLFPPAFWQRKLRDVILSLYEMSLAATIMSTRTDETK